MSANADPSLSASKKNKKKRIHPMTFIVCGPIIDPDDWVLYSGKWLMVVDIEIDHYGGADDYLHLSDGSSCYSSRVRDVIYQNEIGKAK